MKILKSILLPNIILYTTPFVASASVAGIPIDKNVI